MGNIALKIIAIYIVLLLLYVYLIANITSEKNNEYKKIILNNDYYKKLIARLCLIDLPLVLITFDFLCTIKFKIFPLIIIVLEIYLSRNNIIKLKNIIKGNYNIVKEGIDYKITQRKATNAKRFNIYYFRLHNFYKISSKDTQVSEKIFNSLEEKNKVYIVYDYEGNVINICSAKDKIESDKLKDKITTYNKIELFNKKYIDTKILLTKQELNNIKKNELDEVVSLFSTTSLLFLIMCLLGGFVGKNISFGLTMGSISFIFACVFYYHIYNINEFVEANKKGEITVTVEEIEKLEPIFSYKYTDVVFKNKEEKQLRVLQTLVGKLNPGDKVYALYYNNKCYAMLDPNNYKISKEIPVEKE